ncbi:hypothetical protein C8A05DRAFT_12576, partial [Staphylotrichum tortipilum]
TTYTPNMGLLRKLFGRSRKSKPTASGSVVMTNPDPFPDDATFEAVRQHVLRRTAENNPLYNAILREAAWFTPLGWLSANFPEQDGFVFCELGEFPRDIEYKKTVTIPRDDARLYLVGRQGDPNARVGGKKQGGIVCIALCALPPAGVGEGETAGTPFARGTLGTPAINAAEKALLGFIREMQDVGYQGQGPLGEGVEGCLGLVIMGVDMLLYEYGREKGFFDPPGGFEFEDKKVEAEPLPRPPLAGAEGGHK